MGIDMHEEARKIGQLTGEMSCTLQIVKKLKGMGFGIKQVLQTIELPESAVLRVFDGKEDIKKIAEDTVSQQIAENGGKIPQERDFIKWVENALEYFVPEEDKEELIPLKEPQRLTCEQWAQYTPYENKLELFDGQALADLRERENMIIALLYNIGLEHFIKILPQESKTILYELLQEQSGGRYDLVNIVSATMKKMIKYFDGDVKRINHALKVHGFAKSIGKLENIPEDKLRILEVGAILHDIGIKESERKYSSSAGKYQEIEGPPVARDILQEFSLNEEFTDRVCHLIGNHHTYSKIDDVDFQILVEADFLVNIFEDSMTQEQIESIKQKYFKTNTGLCFLNSMYCK
jgi:hypothetical protein